MLLGDSFTNIYSLESMGFGTHGGLAEHLSLALGWPIDRIARNAGGASATREALADDLARHDAIVSRGDVPPTRERLADTKVVVWQFAMRELLSGDWRPVALPDARPETYGHNAAINESSIAVAVTGRIADMTHCATLLHGLSYCCDSSVEWRSPITCDNTGRHPLRSGR